MASRQLLLFVLANVAISAAVAMTPEFEAGIKEANKIAPQLQKEAYNKVKSFDPHSAFDHYNKNPDQTKYYQGVTQKDTAQLENDAAESKNGETNKVILNSIVERPHFVISPSNADIQHSQSLLNDADNIVHGVTSQYNDCKPKQTCSIQYKQSYCDEAPQAISQVCRKKLVIDAIPHETVTDYTLSTHFSVGKKHDYAGVSVNSTNGHINFLGPKDTTFRLDGRLPASIDCHSLEGSIISSEGGAKLDEIHFPSCSNGLNLEYHFVGGHKLDLKIDIVSKIVTYELVDRWVDDCAPLAKNSNCKLQSEQCSVPGSTQVVQGIPVTRDCWEHKFDYVCHGGADEGTCKPLQAQGCEQVNSECLKTTNDQCSRYQQTYRCPIQSCSPTSDVICGNGQEYCLDGNCTDQRYEQSKDFGKAVSALSAVTEASKQIEKDQDPLRIFTGHPAECSEKPMGYSNCCTESGWGQDIGLDHCPSAAKDLHEARDRKVVIKIGRYCSGSWPAPCLEHSQVFCVFSSKLAKIIQEQGRKGQLHLKFGSAKHPNCKGITPEELQALDLSRMDFSDFANDLNKKITIQELKEIQNKIEQQVQQKQREQAHE